MPLVPWHPIWGDLNDFFEDWPRRYWRQDRGQGLRLREPKMDIYEKGGNLVAEIELPGVKPDDVEVEVENNVLKIEAKKEEKKRRRERATTEKKSVQDIIEGLFLFRLR